MIEHLTKTLIVVFEMMEKGVEELDSFDQDKIITELGDTIRSIIDNMSADTEQKRK